jgi:hypothetical protein
MYAGVQFSSHTVLIGPIVFEAVLIDHQKACFRLVIIQPARRLLNAKITPKRYKVARNTKSRGYPILAIFALFLPVSFLRPLVASPKYYYLLRTRCN